MAKYQQFVTEQSERNPSIKSLTRFLADKGQEHFRCRLALSQFWADSDEPETCEISLQKLGEILKETQKVETRVLRGRILVVEDLTRDVVEVLGSSLHVDPLFFASHLHSPWPNVSTQTPDMALLPSRRRTDRYINIHYHRTIVFKDTELQMRELLRTSNVRRKVVLLPKTKGVRIGLAQHSCSILKTFLPNKSWIYPPISNVYYDADGHEKEVLHSNMVSEPFLGGYEDFLDPPGAKNASTCPSGPRRSSMLDDLQYYWKRQKPILFDPESPALIHLAYYPLRIIAAEWVNYLTVMHHSIKQYEYSVKDGPSVLWLLDRLDSDIRSLQSWRRRSMSSQQKLHHVARFVRHSNQTQAGEDGLELLAQDYGHLAASVADFGERFERMLPIVTSMVQIADSRQSLAEAANVTRLTYLAVVFVPLSFTTGLFSMDRDTAPGSQGFWQFFAVAIPLTILVFIVARPPVEKYRQLRGWIAGIKLKALPRYRTEVAGLPGNRQSSVELATSIYAQSETWNSAGSVEEHMEYH
ncbi:mg2+ transporter zinc transport protein [Diplodia corticola]|uniref:Mg2+ transporter zinc transport protein n=1 Tax=Diplodia corticola TaxID=236234 RepID=A0A1J9QSM3_9PEZI|nr:mg2+ transporter zinc transport protein [Diplodia corticola]OJD31448.1 mg2+ transporter zinc transport protein [Diplodia corticola]